jgi:polyphosphate kinase 2 (PPK2 family)
MRPVSVTVKVGRTMSIDTKALVVREGVDVNLKKWPTRVDPVCESKEHYARPLGEHVAKLSSLQQLLYAASSHALLLIFQGMDGRGRTAPSGM